MQLTIGKKVAYPNQGVCLVEKQELRQMGESKCSVFTLRVLKDNSLIMVPANNVDSVGLRPLINRSQCKRLLGELADTFEPASRDWKIRIREFTGKLQSGDVFAAADVFKKLALLSREKALSFREQNMLERAKVLVVTEIADINAKKAEAVETEVINLVESACTKTSPNSTSAMAANAH
jgi:CarD family transcriptional regulator